MFDLSRWRSLAALALMLCWTAAAAAQPLFGGTYTQNFDSMGQAGTAPPAGWGVFTIAGGNGDWSAASGIPASAVGGGTASTGLTIAFIDASNTVGNNNNGYNAATSAAPNDRALVVAPTGVAGGALQAQLVNGTGGPVTSVQVGYDIRRFQAGTGGPDELPGYWLFYSLDNGTTWTNVSQLNPGDTGSGAAVIVPNTVGVTTVPPTTVNLTSPWANGSNIFFRWMDDNGVPSSPDEVIGLDNFSLTATPIPEPASLLSLSAVALLAGARTAVRRRKGAAADEPPA